MHKSGKDVEPHRFTSLGPETEHSFVRSSTEHHGRCYPPESPIGQASPRVDRISIVTRDDSPALPIALDYRDRNPTSERSLRQIFGRDWPHGSPF